MAISRPQKIGGNRTYTEEVAQGHTDIIDHEVDEDFRVIYEAFNALTDGTGTLRIPCVNLDLLDCVRNSDITRPDGIDPDKGVDADKIWGNFRTGSLAGPFLNGANLVTNTVGPDQLIDGVFVKLQNIGIHESYKTLTMLEKTDAFDFTDATEHLLVEVDLSTRGWLSIIAGYSTYKVFIPSGSPATSMRMRTRLRQKQGTGTGLPDGAEIHNQFVSYDFASLTGTLSIPGNITVIHLFGFVPAGDYKMQLSMAKEVVTGVNVNVTHVYSSLMVYDPA